MLVIFQATDDIVRGEELVLPYLDGKNLGGSTSANGTAAVGAGAGGAPDAADFLWHFGFVPRRDL